MPDLGSAPSKTAFVVVNHPLGLRRARPTTRPTRWPRASPNTSPARSPRPRARRWATRAFRPACRSTSRASPSVQGQVDGHQRAARLRPAGGRLPDPLHRQRAAEPLPARPDSGGAVQRPPHRQFNGLVCGVVTNNNDPTSGAGSRWRCRGCRRTTSHRLGPGGAVRRRARSRGRCSSPRSATRCWSASSSATPPPVRHRRAHQRQRGLRHPRQRRSDGGARRRTAVSSRRPATS